MAHEINESGASQQPSTKGMSLPSSTFRSFKTASYKAPNVASRMTMAVTHVTDPVTGNLRSRFHNGEPWLDDMGECIWDPARIRIARIVLSSYAEMSMMFIIFMNLALIVYETDKEAECYPKFKDDLDDCPSASNNIPWTQTMNNTLLTIYVAEALLLIYVLRGAYFKKITHLFDLGIVLGGVGTLILSSVLPKTSWFRILRFARILKIVHVADNIPELYMLIAGLSGSMKAMFFGTIVLGFLLLCFAIVMVQLIHPINVELAWGDCIRCHKSYESIGHSMLTLYQNIVAGDSWGAVSVPIVEASWLGMFLPIAQLVIGVGAMNLILAVVVDRAMEARDSDRHHQADIRRQERDCRGENILRMCRRLDFNGDGKVARHELLRAARTSHELQNLLSLVGLREEELVDIAKYLENDASDIEYDKLCTVLDDVETGDVRKMAVLIKLGLTDLKRGIFERLDAQDKAIDRIFQRQRLVGEHLPHENHGSEPDQQSYVASANINHVDTLACATMPLMDKAPSTVTIGTLGPSTILGPFAVEAPTQNRTLEICALIDSIRWRKIHVTDEVRQLQENYIRLHDMWANVLRDSYNTCSTVNTDVRSSYNTCSTVNTDVRSEATLANSLTTPSLLKQELENFHGRYQVLQNQKFREVQDFLHDIQEDVASLKNHRVALTVDGNGSGWLMDVSHNGNSSILPLASHLETERSRLMWL